MKELDLHFWIRFPSEFKNPKIRDMIKCFLQGYIQGKLEDIPDEKMEIALSKIDQDDILQTLKSVFFTELTFKNIKIITYKTEIIQNETVIDISFWIDFDIEEKEYKCMIAFPAM